MEGSDLLLSTAVPLKLFACRDVHPVGAKEPGVKNIDGRQES